jgi:hypothetical protein
MEPAVRPEFVFPNSIKVGRVTVPEQDLSAVGLAYQHAVPLSSLRQSGKFGTVPILKPLGSLDSIAVVSRADWSGWGKYPPDGWESSFEKAVA